MDLRDQSESDHFCLFCLNETLPCIIPYSEGFRGYNDEESDNVPVIPNFKLVCLYLGVKYHTREGDDDNDPGEESSILSACCDKFLCFNCFERVHNLALLYRQLTDIREKIKNSTQSIKNVILESSGIRSGGEGLHILTDLEFAKVFENRVRQVTTSSSLWKERETVAIENVNLTVDQHDSHSSSITGNSEHELGTDSLSLEIDGDQSSDSLEHVSTTSEEESDAEDEADSFRRSESSNSLTKTSNTINSQATISLRAAAEVEIDGQKKFQCPHCMKLYEKIKSLRNHISRNHLPQNPNERLSVFTCTICESDSTPKRRQFSDKEALSRHIFSKHTSGPKYTCDQCPKRYFAKQQLTNHICTEHKGIRYKCPECPKEYINKSQMKRHLKLEHTKEGLLECPVCSKKFTIHGDLKTHMIIHNDQATKDYICDFCGKEFLMRAQLRKHVYEVHQPERSRRFQCDHCPAKFKSRLEVENHVRKHTGEKPFQCPVCQKCFTQKSQMNKHVKAIHEQVPKKRGRKPNLLETGTIVMGNTDMVNYMSTEYTEDSASQSEIEVQLLNIVAS